MRRTPRSTLTALVFAAALGGPALAAPNAGAIDLTRTWTGKQTCSAFDGTKGSFKFDSTMRVVQSGTTLVVNVDDDFRYASGTIDDAAKPGKGEALFIECGTQPALGDFGEIVRGQVTTAANGTLTFKAASIFRDDGAIFGTCKWTYKRTDPTPPSVTPCP